MSNSDPTAALFLGLGGGLWTFFKGFRVYREYKIIADTPRIPIRSVPMGLVSIRGRAETEQPLVSPVSRTPCCFYRVVIERWKTEERSGHWAHHCTDRDGIEFYLHDETGRILVDSYAAEYDLPESATRVVDGSKPSSSSGTSDAELLRYVERAGAHALLGKAEHWLASKEVEDPAKEQARQKGLEMLQAGLSYARDGRLPTAQIEKMIAARGPLPDANKELQRQAFLEQIHQTGTLPSAERPGGAASGRYRLHEYLILLGQEYRVTGSCMENPRVPAAKDRVVISQGHNEKTFLISARTEQEAGKTLLKNAMLRIVGGAVLSLVCLALLLVKFKMF
jgi:hypothetical protein